MPNLTIRRYSIINLWWQFALRPTCFARSHLSLQPHFSHLTIFDLQLNFKAFITLYTEIFTLNYKQYILISFKYSFLFNPLA